MLKLNYISNLPLSETSGGWSGISASVYQQLKAYYDVSFVGPISPPFPAIKKSVSKLFRSIGLKGQFTFFATSRLQEISKQYTAMRSADATIDFFHGATPWSLCKPPCAYATYIDATFSQYMEVFSQPKQFSIGNLKQIAAQEGAWLRNATLVFCGSQWVQQRVIDEYGLPPAACPVVWVGGNAPIPEQDSYNSENLFLFISLDFAGKGGHLVTQAFGAVRAKIPNAELIIIGERPPANVLEQPGVTYVGLLRKNVPSEYELFCQYLQRGRALIHPTTKDTMGMVLIEAGYFGCPSITTRLFGIPELVKDGETGWLLDVPVTVQRLTDLMLRSMQDEAAYLGMRRQAKTHTTSNLTWLAMGQRIQNHLNQYFK